MENVEIEYKVIISKEDSLILIDKLDSFEHELFIQTNYYYDTLDRKLKQNQASFRIRYIENKKQYLYTLKEKLVEGQLETENILSNNDVNLIKEDLFSKYGIDKKDLLMLGSLKTTRHEYKYKGTNFCIDKSEYRGLTDYEIECESESMERSIRTVEELLNSLNIKYKKSLKSKQARALNQ